MNDIIQSIRKQLNEHVDEKTQVSSQRFFKETIRCYGIKMPKELKTRAMEHATILA